MMMIMMMIAMMMLLWRHEMRVQQRHLGCRCYSAHIKALGSEYIWKIDQFAAYCATLPSPSVLRKQKLHITWAQVSSCKLRIASCEFRVAIAIAAAVDHQLQSSAIVIHKCEFNLKIALILLGCRHL